jgi:hypothetical protein
MARRPKNYKHFISDLKSVQDKANLFAYLLFDQRDSHRTVSEFAQKAFNWFDDLADASHMYIFLPVSEKGEAIENPSLRVAHDLGVHPDEMPGFAFFSHYGLQKPVYFQVDVQVFSDRDKVEALVSALFSIAQKAQEDQPNREEILSKLSELLLDYKKKKKMRDLTDWIVSVPRELAVLPKVFVEGLAKSIGEKIGKKVAG